MIARNINLIYLGEKFVTNFLLFFLFAHIKEIEWKRTNNIVGGEMIISKAKTVQINSQNQSRVKIIKIFVCSIVNQLITLH